MLSLLLGYLLDKVFGDPARLPHPVIWMGQWIAFCERHLNRGNHRRAKGALMAVASIALAYALTWALLQLPAILHSSFFILHSSFLSLLLEAILIFYCLAGTTLIREVRWVFEATERSLDAGRRQVARIVGRDTARLSRDEIHAAALETLAENLNDGVVAPLFWLALLGVPGMVAYKMVNTLDSMVGYHSERYLHFGCWAARIDDVAGYLPARLTALLMVVLSHLPHRGTPTQMTLLRQLRFVRHNGPRHASPNSGWPEAALASILDCRFGGPHDYFGKRFDKPFIGTRQRAFSLADMMAAVDINLLVEVATVLIVAATKG